jgi:hypothetical protein
VTTRERSSQAGQHRWIVRGGLIANLGFRPPRASTPPQPRAASWRRGRPVSMSLAPGTFGSQSVGAPGTSIQRRSWPPARSSATVPIATIVPRSMIPTRLHSRSTSSLPEKNCQEPKGPTDQTCRAPPAQTLAFANLVRRALPRGLVSHWTGDAERRVPNAPQRELCGHPRCDRYHRTHSLVELGSGLALKAADDIEPAPRPTRSESPAGATG